MDKKNFVLNDCKGNLQKRWYVEYYTIENNVKKRVRVYGEINRGKTDDERRSRAAILIKELEKTEKTVVSAPDGGGVRAYLLDFHERNKHLWREKTVQTYLSKITIFLDWATKNGIHSIAAVNRECAEKFVSYLELKRKILPQTRRKYCEILGSAFGGDAWTIPIKRTKAVAALYYQQHQKLILKKYMTENEPQLWFFIEFLYYCFIRPGEIRLLKVSDIYLSEGKILVRADVSKNKKEQFVVIPDVFLPRLYEMELHTAPQNAYIFSNDGYFGAKPLPKNKMNKLHRTVLDKLRFDTKRYKLYSWKHTGAIDKVKAGINVKELQMQLRHADLNETAGYLRDMGINEMEGIRKNSPLL